MSRSQATEIAHARQRLQRFGWPRLQMSVIVLVTAAVGLVSSHSLRLAGLDSMLLRYPLAIVAAYGVFLLLMWAWIRWRRDLQIDEVDVDLLDLATEEPQDWIGSGGGSSGAGSSASWESPSSPGLLNGLPNVELDGEAGLPVAAVLTLMAVAMIAVVAAGWVIWSAPVLMAELMVDAAIAGGLYRRIRHMQAQGWWWLCVRHTIWPMCGVIVFFAAVGGFAQHVAPDATTLSEAVRTR